MAGRIVCREGRDGREAEHGSAASHGASHKVRWRVREHKQERAWLGRVQTQQAEGRG
jgi:hypothetical protein